MLRPARPPLVLARRRPWIDIPPAGFAQVHPAKASARGRPHLWARGTVQGARGLAADPQDAVEGNIVQKSGSRSCAIAESCQVRASPERAQLRCPVEDVGHQARPQSAQRLS